MLAIAAEVDNKQNNVILSLSAYNIHAAEETYGNTNKVNLTSDPSATYQIR